MIRKLILLVAVFALAAAGFFTMAGARPAQSAMADEAKVRKLLDLTGAGALGKSAAGQMMNSFRQSMPNVPADFWNEFETELKPEGLVDLIVPIYQKHFSNEDVDGLIAFYESPVGKKFSQEQPGIAQDSMAAGQRWGQEIAQKVMRKLQEKGIQPK